MSGDFEHGQVQANGISIHTVSAGQGPLVLFCHGFPESWYSWRHQLPAVAAAGFRAVALDMRGYGQTTAPTAVTDYGMSQLVGDVVGTVAALGEEQAVVVGHDWSAPVAWYSALMRPDVFRAVAALSVPYTPPMVLPDGLRITDLYRAIAGDRDYYRLYFQEPGVAEEVLEADVDRTVRSFLYMVSGDIVTDGVRDDAWDGHFPKGENVVDQFVMPKRLPGWLTEDDVAFYVSELSRTGFRGGLNWYRNLDAVMTVLAPFVGATIKQPAIYVAGALDAIAGNTPEVLDALPGLVPGLRDVHVLPDAGHWVQQERPREVNEALVNFLTSL